MGFSLRKKGWPRYALAASPELVRHVSAVCPPCVRLESVLAVPPNLVRLCRPLVSAFYVSTTCLLCVSPGLPYVLDSGLCPLVACCAAGPWHHEVKFFLSIAQPTAFILHAHKRTPCLKKCLGLCWYNFLAACPACLPICVVNFCKNFDGSVPGLFSSVSDQASRLRWIHQLSFLGCPT